MFFWKKKIEKFNKSLFIKYIFLTGFTTENYKNYSYLINDFPIYLSFTSSN